MLYNALFCNLGLPCQNERHNKATEVNILLNMTLSKFSLE